MYKYLSVLRASKAKSITVSYSQIIVCLVSKNEKYGVYDLCYSYENNPRNLLVASKYKKKIN